MKPAPVKPASAARKAPPPPAPAADAGIARSLTGVMGSIILAGALGAFVFGNERSNVMLAVSHEARGVTALQAMDMPNIGSDALINWSKLAISEIFTYNFNDIGPRTLAAERYFTKAGWTSFIMAMGDQDVLGKVQGQRQFVSTIPTENAVISEEGEVSGTYFWTVQLSYVTSVYTGTTSTKPGNLTLKVARISTRHSDAGYPFGIVQIIR